MAIDAILYGRMVSLQWDLPGNGIEDRETGAQLRPARLLWRRHQTKGLAPVPLPHLHRKRLDHHVGANPACQSDKS
jgi:hypothetical protein